MARKRVARDGRSDGFVQGGPFSCFIKLLETKWQRANWIYRPGNYRKCHGGYSPKGTSFKRVKRNQVYIYRVASAFTGGSRKNVYLWNIYVRGNDLWEEIEDEIEVCGLCNKYRLAHHHDNSLLAALRQFIFTKCQKDRTAKRFIYYYKYIERHSYINN